MSFERLAAIGEIVLRGDRQDHAVRREILQVFLEGAMRLAVGAVPQGDAERACFADDAAPERVVEIDHDHFLGTGRQRARAGRRCSASKHVPDSLKGCFVQ